MTSPTTPLHWITPRDDAQLAHDAAQLFRQQFDAEPEGVWAAPGRVNVLGDHVDYAGGISIPFALQLNTAVAARRNGTDAYRVVSLPPGGAEAVRLEMHTDHVGPSSPSSWAGYALGAIWAACEAGIIPTKEGLDLAIVSDVPVGSGLSSSAALECASALAALELGTGQAVTDEQRGKLVDACIRAENEVVGASTGGLDQRASLFGHTGQALVIDFSTNAVEAVPFDLQGRGLSLLIADTNAPHALNDGQYASRRGIIDEVTAALGEHPGATLRDIDDAVRRSKKWADEQGKDSAMVGRRVQHVVEETERTKRGAEALSRDDLVTFCHLMCESHESLRDQYEVVTEELESAFQAAGRDGARMTGGGFGGSVIALVASEDVSKVASDIADAARKHGYPEPTFLEAVPGEGARRLG